MKSLLVTDILEFGRSIGVHNMYISPRYAKSGDVLHELAHNAVCTDSQLARRVLRDANRPELGYLIPSIQYQIEGKTGRGYRPGIMSPDEFGTRVWALEVLEYFNLPIPENTGNPHIYDKLPSSLLNGKEQLLKWHIEPLKGIFRPTVVPSF